jgi:hypothetical protein
MKMLTKSNLFIILIILLFSNQLISQVQWEKIFNSDSLESLIPQRIYKNNDKLVILYTGKNKNQQYHYTNSGMIITDFDGNNVIQKEYYCHKPNYVYGAEFYKGNCYVYSKYYWANNGQENPFVPPIPSLLVYDNNWNIIEKKFDSTLSPYISGIIGFYHKITYGLNGKDRDIITINNFNDNSSNEIKVDSIPILKKFKNIVYPENRFTLDGNFIFIRFCSDSSYFKWKDNFIYLVDSLGKIIWLTHINRENEYSEIYRTSKTNDSGFILTGYSYDIKSYKKKLLIIKLDKDGIFQWEKEYPIHSSVLIYDGLKTIDNGKKFVLFGGTMVNGKDTLTNFDEYDKRYFCFYIIDENGNLLNETIWAPSWYDTPDKVKGHFVSDIVEKDGIIFVIGKDSSSIYLAEVAPILTSVDDDRNNKYSENSLRITPNPVINELLIESDYYNSDMKAQFYNITGVKLLETRLNIPIDVSHFPTGIYFVRVGITYKKFTKL